MNTSSVFSRIVPAEELSSLPGDEEPPHPKAKAGNTLFILPNDHKPISESAREIFTEIAPTHTLFTRARSVVELIRSGDSYALDLLRPEAFRSRLERYGRIVCAWKTDGTGQKVLKPNVCPEGSAKALLCSSEALD